MASFSTDPFGGFSPTGGVIPPVCETPAGKPRVCPTVQSTGFGPFLAGNGPHSRKKGTGGAFMRGTAFITGSSRGIGRGGGLLLPGGVRLCHRPGPHRRREAFCNGKAPSALSQGSSYLLSPVCLTGSNKDRNETYGQGAQKSAEKGRRGVDPLQIVRRAQKASM